MGGEIIAKKGARVVWTNDNEFLVVTGFTRQSERTLTVYRTEDLKKVSSETLNVSPAILIPFYDEDSSTLFLQGKGETTMYCYEVGLDSPHLFSLNPADITVPVLAEPGGHDKEHVDQKPLPCPIVRIIIEA